MESYHINNTACPKCRENGNDNTGNNLAVYSDGHVYCWSCRYYKPGSSLPSRDIQGSNKLTLPDITLPNDASMDYPSMCLEWVDQYDLTKKDLIQNNVLWSEKQERLLFPLWNQSELLGYQGRYFGNEDRVKWLGKGKLNNVYHFLTNGKQSRHSNTVCLVEDIISAIKVSKIGVCSLPLFGMNAKSRFKHMRSIGVSKALLWLDPNMYTQMIKQSRTGSLEGLEVVCVFSTKDPKEHSYTEIEEYTKCK